MTDKGTAHQKTAPKAAKILSKEDRQNSCHAAGLIEENCSAIFDFTEYFRSFLHRSMDCANNPPAWGDFCMGILKLGGSGGEYRNRTGVHGFAIRCVTTPPTRLRGICGVYGAVLLQGLRLRKW